MPPSAEPLLDSASASSTARGGVELDWLTQKVRCVRGSVSRRAMHASGDSPSHLSAKHHLLATYLRLMVSFRGMLLTLQSGLERLTPQAHRVPVYPTVFPHSDMSLHGARSGRCKASAAALCSARLEGKDQAHPSLNSAHRSLTHLPTLFHQKRFVHGNNLGHIRHRVFREPRLSGR